MNYKQKYIEYFDYTPDENILCEVCGKVAVDIHHIVFRSQGGTDDIDNLIGVCRTCHDKAHNERISKEFLKEIVKKRE